MANGWTPERRARQAELIRTWRPWEKATGPKSAEGKAKVARNAYSGGHWRVMREITKKMNAMRQEKNSLV